MVAFNTGIKVLVDSSKQNTIFAWGMNSAGQLGRNNTTNTSSPVQVGTLTNWRYLSCGYDFVNAVKTDGTLWSWGNNSLGQLGDIVYLDTPVNKSSPVQVGSLTDWLSTDPDVFSPVIYGCGSNGFAAIKTDGTLWMCGYNGSGQMGNNSNTNNYSSPVQIGSLTNWKQIGIAYAHTLAVKTDGTLWTWGRNENGQLGNGNTTSYSSPIQIGALTNWATIAPGGFNYSLAVKTDGTLWAWGRNQAGQLGIGNTTNYSSPVQVGALTDWKQVSCGYLGSAAVKTDGTLWAWGWSQYGELGVGSVGVYYSSPVQVGSLTNWKQVSCGYFHTTATKTDNTLWAWGRNNDGQLGPVTGSALATSVSSMTQIATGKTWLATNPNTFIVSALSSKSEYTSVIATDGTLWAWGNNSVGQLGNGNTTKYSSPVQIGSLTNWKQVSNGGNFTAAIKTDGTLWVWGSNNYGQLAVSNLAANYSSPVQVGTLTNWSTVSAGQYWWNAIKTDGTLWSCGYGVDGQMGNNLNVNYSSPVQVGTLTDWKYVSGGQWHVIATKTDGTLWAWGYGSTGSLGLDNSASFSSPVQVGTLTTWSQASAGSGITLAVKTDGTLWGWGSNGSGQLGNGSTTTVSSPVQVGTLTDWKFVSSGTEFASAIKTDGTLWAWGRNQYGQLGIGNTTNYSSPVQVGSLTTWTSVQAGNYYMVGITNDNKLYATGNNSSGQLTDISVTIYNANTSSPIQVGSLTDWKYVSNSSRSTLAVKTDGTFWSWGLNNFGQLGDNTTTTYSSPIQIGSLTTWRTVQSGYTNVAGTKTDGTIWKWGRNFNGQLASYDSVAQTALSSPVQIGSLTNWYYLAGGSESGYGIKTDGTLWAWGGNSKGQLGIGNTTTQSSAVQVGTLTNWSQISTFGRHFAAIKTDGTLWTCGYGTSGELGNNAALDYSSPIQVGSLTNWSQVAACGGFTLAIKTDGTLWACGYNAYGQLGIGNTTNYSSPVQVGALTNWKKAVGGSAWAAAVKTDGTLWTWGSNVYGQLGNGNTTSYSSPIQVGSLTNWINIGSSARSVLAVNNKGELWAWGRNINGQLGNGSTADRSSPIQVGTLSNWYFVTGSGNFSAAIGGVSKQDLSDRYVTKDYLLDVYPNIASALGARVSPGLFAWGDNTFGQLGLGSNSTKTSSPVQVGSLTNWKQVSNGNGFAAAIKSDGTLWAWGSNNNGQLGNNTTTYYSSPIQVGSLTTWNQVSAGNGFTAATKTDGTLWTWGLNSSGQLGNGNNTSYSSPIQVGALTTWKQVKTGASHILGLMTDGTVWTSGLNSSGQLGNNSTTNSNIPVQVLYATIAAGTSVTSITNSLLGPASLTLLQNASADDANVLATIPWSVNFLGTTYTDVYVGSNSYLTFGAGFTAYSGLGPGNPAIPNIMISGADNSYQRVYAGTEGTAPNRTYRIRYEGTNSTSGTVGSSNMIWEIVFYEATPTQIDVQIGSNARYPSGYSGVLSASALISSAVNGAPNTGYRITYSASPVVTYVSLDRAAQISASDAMNLVTRTDSTLWSWGDNTYGQLGINSTTPYSYAVQVGSLTTWSQVSSGYNFSAGLLKDGTLWAWGRNDNGQLGNGNTTDYSSPIQVGGLTNWKLITTGYDFAAGIKIDGTLWTWGSNADGQLGNGSITKYSSPIQVGSLNTWKRVSASNASASNAYMLAIRDGYF